MKKTILIVALFIGVLLFAGNYAQSRHQRPIGSQAPALSFEAVDSLINLDRMRGDYSLVTFWSSTDARSRQAANQYTAWLRQNPDTDIRFIGVNFDDSKGLFNEIVKRDSLMSESQYNVSGHLADEIYRSYNLDEGLGSVLIAPDGKIVAYNPSQQELDALTH